MNKIRIAIADDYKIYRDGLKVGLGSDDNLQVVLGFAKLLHILVVLQFFALGYDECPKEAAEE